MDILQFIYYAFIYAVCINMFSVGCYAAGCWFTKTKRMTRKCRTAGNVFFTITVFGTIVGIRDRGWIIIGYDFITLISAVLFSILFNCMIGKKLKNIPETTDF